MEMVRGKARPGRRSFLAHNFHTIVGPRVCATGPHLPSTPSTVRNTTLYGADTFAVMRGTTNGVKKNYAIINISYGHAL